MKTKIKITLMRAVMFAVLFAGAWFMAGCTSPKKLRDIELRGMYVNGYSEVLAIGEGRLTSIPGEREALAAHYEEDTAWLAPNTKVHKIDIFLVGSNSVDNATAILGNICKAFAEVAPSVAAAHAANAKGGTTALDVIKASGETRKAVQLSQIAADKVKGQLGSDKVSVGSGSVKAGSDTTTKDTAAGCTDCQDTAAAGCTDCKDAAGACTDCEDK